METEKKWYMAEYANKEQTDIIEEYPENMKTISNGGPYWMISCPYPTKEALLIGEKVAAEPCKMCGQYFATHYANKERLIEKNICFGCAFWDEMAERKDRIIADHNCYKDGGRKNSRDGFLGFGGAEWKIRMNDGRLVETNNLWHNGNIPKRFWDRMPDNAVILQPVTRTSKHSNIERTMWLPRITQEQSERLEAGEHIQAVLTNYTDSEREFVITGITQEEWDEIFKEEKK